MAVMHGKDGALKVGTDAIGYIDNYSINITQDTAEISAVGDQWKKYIEGARSWSGSLSGTLDYADVGQAKLVDDIINGTTTALVGEFKFGPTLTLSGEIQLTSLNSVVAHGDKVTISINFNGSGALTKKNVA